MTFSYDPTQIHPATGQPISAIRWLVQDIIAGEAEMQDEEISALYNATPASASQLQRVYMAAASCAAAILTRYSREVDWSSNGTSVTASKRVEHWRALYEQLAAEARNLSLGEGLTVIDAGRVGPWFWRT